MASVNRHDSRRERESLLDMFRGTSGSASGNASSNSSKDKKMHTEWKEQENKKKAEIEELNAPLETLLPCSELWDALSNSLCKFCYPAFPNVVSYFSIFRKMSKNLNTCIL